ncbi:MAG TPA: hypothetical protein VGJ05_11405 [Fimbriiglobus sp.]|jgi:hypothetical protein
MGPLLLSDEQRTVIEQSDDPIRVIDPKTNRTYVLVREALFDSMMASADEFHPRDAYAAIDRAFAEGWSDSKMDDYDRCEEIKR